MKVLLHICCGPCAIYCVNNLRKKNLAPEGFFYNPNIHSVDEYKNRKQAVVTAMANLNTNVYFYRDYQFEDFFRKITFHENENRCELCWELRLKNTAEFAKKNNFDAFTTTLLISPYQDHEKIKQIAESFAQKYNIKFLYEDFRIGFRQSHDESHKMGLYHQKYCGCVYSERERVEAK